MTKKQLKFAHTYQINVCENKIKIKRIPHGDQSCGIFIKYSFLRNPNPRYTIYALPAMPETALRRCHRIDNSCASEPLRYAIHQTRSGYTDLTRQYEEKKAEYESLLERKKAMEATSMVFSGILFRLTELEEIPIDFDEALWNTLVDYVTVYADERIVFSFMDGTEIAEIL